MRYSRCGIHILVHHDGCNRTMMCHKDDNRACTITCSALHWFERVNQYPLHEFVRRHCFAVPLEYKIEKEKENGQ